jgi:archaellum component FlaG (FlaF/FlaG flagellin family)
MNASNRMTIILAVVAGSIISVALVSAVIVSSSDANNAGSSKTAAFSVYWDQSCTNRTQTINWGTVEPNTTKSLTVYIKNTGAIPIRLNMKTSQWNPTTTQKYVTLTWDRENSILNRASNITATFTLRMPSDVANLATFSFVITITGTQTKS